MPIRFAFYAAFGPDQFFPAPAAFFAPSDGLSKLAEVLVAAALDGADFAAGNDKAGAILVTKCNRMNLTDIDAGNLSF